LTGYCVSNGEILLSNNLEKDNRFNASIDNLPGLHEVYNIMMCPIIDEYEDFTSVIASMKNEDREKLSKDEKKSTNDIKKPKKLLGVIQLINKRNRANINDFD